MVKKLWETLIVTLNLNFRIASLDVIRKRLGLFAIINWPLDKFITQHGCFITRTG